MATKKVAAAQDKRVPLHKSLSFVRGALDAGQIVPTLKNFAIDDGVIQGSNGIVTLTAPIDTELSACVNAERFARAIAASGENIALAMTKTGNLTLKSGSFRAVIPATSNVDEFPWVEPEGDSVNVPENFIEQIAAVRPFVGSDATRRWSLGIRVEGDQLYASNNVIAVRAKLFSDLEFMFTIPTPAVDELLRLKVNPKRILLAEGSVTFVYARGWWMRSALVADEWPDIDALIEKASTVAGKTRITDAMRHAVDKLMPFMNTPFAPMYIRKGSIATSANDDDAIAFDDVGVEHTAAFVGQMLKLIIDSATHINLATFPDPVSFVGKNVMGVCAGYGPKQEQAAKKEPMDPSKFHSRNAKKD